MRSAGSKGPVDLIALYQRGHVKDVPMLIQAKIGKMSKGKRLEFDAFARKYGSGYIATPDGLFIVDRDGELVLWADIKEVQNT